MGAATKEKKKKAKERVHAVALCITELNAILEDSARWKTKQLALFWFGVGDELAHCTLLTLRFCFF